MKMEVQSFWEWVNVQSRDGEKIYIVPTVNESIILAGIEYICETSYFYRGAELWGIDEWDEHMEDYFMDMRDSQLEIPKRLVYRTIRTQYVDYTKKLKKTRNNTSRRITRTRRSIPLGIRWRVLERDGRRCQICGASPATDVTAKLHVDHIVPVSRGGASTMDNLQTLCEACNLGKSNRIL